jgi:hypothetical protein
MITIPDYHVLEKSMDYLRQVPFDVTPQSLYNASILYDTLQADPKSPVENCYDQRVYHHYIDNGKIPFLFGIVPHGAHFAFLK